MMSSFPKHDERAAVVDESTHEGLSDGPISCAELSRRDERALIFHLLYAVDSFDYEESVPSVVNNYNHGFDLDIPFDGKMITLIEQVVARRQELDEIYKPFLSNWRFERLSTATYLILRFATWELVHTDTDARIVINEAIELAKCFAEKDAYRFINGVLDRVAKLVGKEVVEASQDETIDQIDES